jgi:hypothetical protein
MRLSSSTLVRLCGLASIAAGLLWSIGTLFNFVTGGSIEPANTAGAIAALVTNTVMGFAFLGIYAGQVQEMGLLGTLGTFLGIVGTTLLVGVNTVAFSRMVGAVEVLRPPLAIGIPGVLSLLTGVVLLGVATMRVGVYHKWAGLPFILALVLFPLRWIQEELAILAILVASLGFVWLGWEVWSHESRERIHPAT